jgi:hypothetical protein
MLRMTIDWRKSTLAACGTAALLFALAPIDARAETGLCPAPERALFSCAIGAKEVAVCASGDLAQTTGTIQYRFGRPSRVELAYPPAGGDWRAVTRSGTLAFSGGGGAFLAFERPPYRYVVYTAIGQGWGSKAGVVVEKSGKRIANLKCATEARSELGPDLFSSAGIAPFEDSFELP